jgi:hypothetical protein
MMRVLMISLMLLLAGCAQLMKGQQQPVVSKGQGNYFTTCSGTVEEWGSCYSKAKQTCPSGYEVTNKVEGSVGGKREMEFMCK